MKSNKLTYFAQFDIDNFIGVAKKIQQTVTVLNNEGISSTSFLISEKGVLGHLKLFKGIMKFNGEIIIIRTTYYTMHLMFFALLWQRIKNTKIIIEIPTPNTTVWREIDFEWGKSYSKKWLRKILLSSSLPWSLWPAHKIIQYAPESFAFGLGLKYKTKIHSNGIDVSEVPLIKNTSIWTNRSFVMVGMGVLAEWHGYDRIINGMSLYLKSRKQDECDVHLYLIGDGEVCRKWKMLADNLKLNNNIHFLGVKVGGDLDDIFENSNVALGSLGLYRKGLDQASDLKSREYTARGIPFLAAGNDIDFNSNTSFRLNLPNNNEVIDIKEVIKWFVGLNPEITSPNAMRKYAQENLDFKLKVKKLITIDAD